MGIQITLERYDVQVLGHRFQFIGQMEPVGRVLDYFGKGNRSTFPMYDVSIYPLTPGSSMKAISQPEIIVSDRELGLIYFPDDEYRAKVETLKNFDRVIAYTPFAILRGNFHRGAETKLVDLFDVMQGTYLAMTEVNVFPLTKLPAAFPRQTDMLIVNRSYVDTYHPE